MDVFELSSSISLSINEYQEQLNRAFQMTEQAFKNIETVMRNVNVPKIIIPSPDTKSVTQSVQSIPSKMSSSLKEIGTNITNAFKNGVKKAGEALKELPKKAVEVLKETGEKLKNVAETVSKAALATVGAASAAVVGFGKTAVDAGMNFDKSMSQVAATMGKTVDEVDDLREFAKKMGNETAFSASQAADGLNILAMAGLSANEQIDSLGIVLNTASAGGLDLATSASYITGAVKGFSDSMDNAQYYADLIAKGATLANTSVAGLGEAFSAGASTVATYGQNAKSFTVSLLRLAEQNVTGAEAATALTRAMADIYTPTTEAQGALSELGVKAFDETTGKARDFNEVVDELNSKLSTMDDQLKSNYTSTIFTTYGMKAFNKMTTSSAETVNKFSDGLAHASDGIGAAAQQAETQLDNLAGDVTLFKSALEGVQIAVSEQLTPALRDFVKIATNGLSDITKSFETGDLNSAINAVGKFLADMTAKILQTIPKVIEVASSVISSFGKTLAEGFPSIAKGILSQLSGLARNISNEAPEMIRGFSEMLSRVTEWLKRNSGLLISEVMNMINSIATGIKDNLPDIMNSVTEILIFIGDTISENSDLLLDSGLQIITAIIRGITKSSAKLIDNFSKILKNIANWLGKNGDILILAGYEMLQAIFDGLSENISSMTESITEIITFIVKIISDNLPLIINIALDILGTFAQAILNNVPLLLNSAINIILSLANFMTDNLDKIIPAIVDVVLKIVEVLTNPDTLSSLIDAAIAIIIGLADGIMDSLPELIDRLPEIVQGIVDGLVENVPKLLDAAIEIIEKLSEFLTNEENADKIITAAFEIITTLVEGAGDFLYKLGELADDMIQKIADELGLGEAYEWGKDLVINFCNGIKDWYTKEGGLEDTMEDFGERIYDWLHHSTPEKGPLKDDDKWGGDFADNFINGIKSRESTLSKTIENTANILSDIIDETPNFSIAEPNGESFLNNFIHDIQNRKNFIVNEFENISKEVKSIFDKPISLKTDIIAKGILSKFEMPNISENTNIPIIANGEYVSENNFKQNSPLSSYEEKSSPVVVENLYLTLEGMNFVSEFERKRFFQQIADELKAMKIIETRGTGGVMF